jgi:dTDP-4-amino-4,6-dideoxygalactose transaminase
MPPVNNAMEFIPLFDLELGAGTIEAVTQVLRSKWLTMGEMTSRFETAFGDYIGAPHCLAVSNGTAALHLALQALGIGPGDEVICPSLTFVATANAVLYTGATPVFADIVGTDDLNINPRSIEANITDRTRAVIVVHYAGFLCEMAPVCEMARRHGLKIIEDAAHAPGAAYIWPTGKGVAGSVQKAGTIGDVGCFSFFSNKNLAGGEGGMVTTPHEAVAEKVRLMRSHGMTTLTLDRHKGHSYSYDVVEQGYNYRIDEIRAAIGMEQLKHLDAGNLRRQAIDQRYRELLRDIPGIVVPFGEQRGRSAHHIFPILLPEKTDRAAFMERMRHEKGIQTSIHYPPVHRFDLYRRLYNRNDAGLEQTRIVGAREVTLPISPTLRDDQVAYIAASVEEVLAEL